MIDIPISEAILVGCELAPKQTFGKYYGGDGPESGRACVAGAMYLGLGFSPYSEHDNLDLRYACPVCKKRGATSIIVHLNDAHRWSRQRIAAWYHRTFEESKP